jgi:aminopeptidase
MEMKDQLSGALMQKYAACIVDVGLALRRGQYLLVSALTVHRDLALAVAEEAYRCGASFVNVLYQDELLQKTQLALGDEASVTFLSKSVIAAFEEVIERRGAYLSLSGRENPNAFHGLDPDRQSRSLLSRQAQLDFFYQEIYTNRIAWCVAAAATPGTAAIVFPGQPAGAALTKLWDCIFSICRITEPDPAAAWREQAARLQHRKERLDELSLRELHFTSPTCDLSLRLSERARWKGGFASTPDGRAFLPNLPTEEVFTVPDWRSLEGTFQATRPLTYKNIHVAEAKFIFRSGQITAVEGGTGVDELRRILASEPAHGRAGEIALVGEDSAVARSGLVFHDLLYDENAACHLALGSGYTECLEGIGAMSREERDAAGFNTASLHIDVMLGSPLLGVTGSDAQGTRHVLIIDGLFAPGF